MKNIMDNFMEVHSDKLYKKNECIFYIIPSLIVSLILIIVYLIKGIYPFGKMSIVYADLGQMYIPIYYHLYDVVYSGKSLFYDFYSGAGVNMWGNVATHGLLSPITWLVLLSKRDNIVYFFSYILLVRMALIALTSYIFFHKTFQNLHQFWKISFSVMYAFSGYVLIIYTNIMWLDNVMLFPLLILSLKALYDKHKVIGYIVTLTASIIFNFYIAYMVLFFIFFTSGLYVYFYVNKEQRGKSIILLGFGTVSSLLLSSFLIIPTYIQINSSIRANMSVFDNILKSYMGPVWNKAIFFFFAAIIYVVLIRLAMTYKRDKKFVIFAFSLIFLTSIQVFVESINLIWHTGSYILFPLRFGFIPIFVIFAVCCCYLMRNPIDGSGLKFNAGGKKTIEIYMHIIQGIIALICFVCALLIALPTGTEINKTVGNLMLSDSLIQDFFLVCLLFAVVYWFAFKLNMRRVSYIIIGITLCTEIFIYSSWFIGVEPQFRHVPEHSDEMIFSANKIRNAANFNDNFERVRDKDNILNANYPFVLGKPSLSNWTHIITQDHQNTMKFLGYSVNYTRVLDCGGTIFSDLILGVRHILSKKVLDDRVYTKSKTVDDIYLYEYKNSIPIGMVMTDKISGAKIDGVKSPFDVQNLIYKKLSGIDENIIDMLSVEPSLINVSQQNTNRNVQYFKTIDKSEPGYIEYSIAVSKLQNLYINKLNLSMNSYVYVYVNNELVEFPTMRMSNYYPTFWNNGIIDLGVYKDQTVKIKIKLTNDTKVEEIVFGQISIDKYQALAKSLNEKGLEVSVGGNEMAIKANIDSKVQGIFLPITYDEGWLCKINGKEVPVKKAFGNFVSIDVGKGKNDIRFNFVPQGFHVGGLISLITLMILGLLYFINRKFTMKFHGKILIASEYSYFFIYIVGLVVVYIIPIAIFVLRSGKKVAGFVWTA